MQTRSFQTRRCRGLGLIELLVGIVVSLIVLLAIMQSFALFEGQRRTTASTDTAQQNGLAALFHIEREVRMAGHGSITPPGNIPCTVIKAYNVNASTPAYDLRMAPVLLEHSAGAAGDKVTVLYSSSQTGGIPIATLATAMANSAAALNATTTLGVKTGDRLVISSPTVGCAQLVATATPSATNVVHTPGSSGNEARNPPDTTNILPGVLPIGARVTNFGNFTNRRYEVVGDRLVETDLSAGLPVTQTELVAGVVHMQTAYGLSQFSNTDVITAWQEPTSSGAWSVTTTTPSQVNLMRVKAVRIAVVARSDLLEKTDISPTALTLWPGGPTYTVPDRKYRYRVYETIVPMRNTLWGNPNPAP